MTGHFSQRTKTSSGGSNGLKSHWQIKQNDSFLVFLLQQVHIKFYHSHQNNNKEQRNILKTTYYYTDYYDSIRITIITLYIENNRHDI